MLPLVLALFAVGGLVLTPTIRYAASSIASVSTNEMGVHGLYAADAGIEYVVRSVRAGEDDDDLPTQLPENMNGMEVAIQTVNKGAYTLYMGQFVSAPESHNDYLTISGDIVWDPAAQAYKYTITTTRQPEATGNISLQEVGVRLPVGYSYQTGSAASFSENLSTANPSITTDASGAEMLGWVFSNPKPTLTSGAPVKTEEFYFTGTGNLTGDYTWVVATRSDIGTVSEVSGNLYVITSTATSPSDGAITARIKADVLVDSGGVAYIVSWQVLQ